MNPEVIMLDQPTVNLVWSTDWHASARPPGRRQDDYQQAILDKIDFVRVLTEECHGVSVVGGDIFHIKTPKSTANSFELLISLIHALRRFPTGKVYGTVGNHDLLFDQMESLATQPLGLLIAAGVYRNVVDAPVVFTNNIGTVRVQVETFPYADGEKTLERLKATGPRPEGITHRVALVHAYGLPGNAATLFGERKIGYNEVKDLDFDLFLWGHDHSRHETEKVGNITHINLGSMARAAYASDETDRPVVAVTLSFGADSMEYKEVAIPVKPLEIAFIAADKGVENVSRTDEVTEFFDEMDEAVGGIESSDSREVLAQLCPNDKPLLDLVIQLCEL
jgi:DNA repair exonuclease SbcCD nuclease subunit